MRKLSTEATLHFCWTCRNWKFLLDFNMHKKSKEKGHPVAFYGVKIMAF